MHSFTDTKGRAWTIVVDVLAIKRVRAEAGVDLMTVLDGAEASAKITDPCALVDVLWALVSQQASVASVSAQQFAESLDGDTLDAASRALLGGLVDFFPAPRRKILRALMEKTERYMASKASLAEQKLEALDLDKLMEGQGLKLSGG